MKLFSLLSGVVCLLVNICFVEQSVAQQDKLTNSVYTFQDVQQNGELNWDKFPEFKLPSRYQIVYQGPRFIDDTQQKPLKHGFSHLATFNLPYDSSVPFENRAGFSSGIPINSGQPWGTPCLDPWNNNVKAIDQKILEYAGHCEFFKECISRNYKTPYSLFVHDFESSAPENWILPLRSQGCFPQYGHLTNNQFVALYKKGMINLHGQLMKYTREQLAGVDTKISLYGESPIPHIYESIAELSMDAYKLNSVTNYLLQDTTLTFSNSSPVMKYNDFMTPWCYYHYRYDENGVAGKKGAWSYLFLPHLLFSIEAQKFWTSKSIIPFVQMRVQPGEGGDTDLINKNIDPEMAEATAIFSILGGGQGVWIWDQINTPIRQDPNSHRNYKPYEHFVGGLYRLSRFNDIIESPDALYAPINARDLAGTRVPVVRGMIKGDRILIAAMATDVDANAITKVPVAYQSWRDTITLKGREIFLGSAVWKCYSPDKERTVTATSNSPVTESQIIQLKATGGMAYSWSGPSNFSSSLASPQIFNISTSKAGIYSITAQVSNACTNSTTIEVKVSAGGGTTSTSNACNKINLKVILEGPYDAATGKMKIALNQRGLLPGQVALGVFALNTPKGHPYGVPPWNYQGTESVDSYDTDIVDWIKVTLRSASDIATVTFTGVGLLKSDGSVKMVTGCANNQNLVEGNSFYAVLEHRNHLGVMSATPVTIKNQQLSYDFTTQDSYKTTNPPSYGEKKIGERFVMFAVDAYKASNSQNYDINSYDFQVWKNENGVFNRYTTGDVNLDGEVNATDIAFWRKNNGIYSKVPR
jgi:hypothetical protein